MILNGGGASGDPARNAYISIRGNDKASVGGSITIAAGKGIEGAIVLNTNNTERIRITSAGDTTFTNTISVTGFSTFYAGAIIGGLTSATAQMVIAPASSAVNLIRTNTVANNDYMRTTIQGGGASSNTRGAAITVYGHDYSTAPNLSGCVEIYPANNATAYVEIGSQNNTATTRFTNSLQTLYGSLSASGSGTFGKSIIGTWATDVNYAFFGTSNGTSGYALIQSSLTNATFLNSTNIVNIRNNNNDVMTFTSAAISFFQPISGNNTITSTTFVGNNFTASTLVYSNASKNIVSLANSDGYLKNTAGTFSYDNNVLTKTSADTLYSSIIVSTYVNTISSNLNSLSADVQLKLYTSAAFTKTSADTLYLSLTSGGIVSANVSIIGIVSATGNIRGVSFIGNSLVGTGDSLTLSNSAGPIFVIASSTVIRPNATSAIDLGTVSYYFNNLYMNSIKTNGIVLNGILSASGSITVNTISSAGKLFDVQQSGISKFNMDAATGYATFGSNLYASTIRGTSVYAAKDLSGDIGPAFYLSNANQATIFGGWFTASSAHSVSYFRNRNILYNDPSQTGGLGFHLYSSAANFQISTAALGSNAAFTVDQNGNSVSYGTNAANGFIGSNLSASTLIYADASKKLVSLANAVGFAYNNGSGAFTYDNNVLTKTSADTLYLEVDGTNAMTGTLNLMTGTSAKSPLKFTSGTLLSTPLAGALEFDGIDLWLTY